ncbi:hypothetical protein [Dongia sedimenti]|uniref:Uncharacterized protein n=1 Tax=Dongia sedimenti TaxID=3064282 RepID=A0ABU0YPN1_9PROT|nr:hypothetical protein [Rhodospirillaceae bacterium R-7]
MTDAAALFTAKTPPGLFAAQAPSGSAPLGSTEGSGAISGGLLRPGSIDQATFLQMLQQQQQNRQAAGVGGKPVSMPIQRFQPAPSIPTLSSAQFAALVGAQNADPGLAAAPVEGAAGDPQAVAAAQIQTQARATAAMAPALRLSGANRNAAPSPNGNLPAAASADEDRPTISRKSAPQAVATTSGDALPTITRKSAPVLESSASETAAKQPAESDDETASKSDPDVVHLKQPPDKDEQKELRMRNKRWVVDETPGARQLFFGADGTFGWDDFVDMINPLQHIPGIAQIYRAVTGDEINGAASLLGAIPFGPFGGLGLIASVADLAVKDTTGRDIGGNLQAMLFGKDGTPEGTGAAPADMAEAPEAGAAPVQTATRETRYALADASALHSACRG